MDCLNISSCTDLLRPMSRLSISLQIAAKTASIILEGRKFLGVNFLPYKMKTEKDEEMEDLNSYALEYSPNAATEIENNLVLHWYPRRILSRFNIADSLLELGLGHGFTAELFAKACNRHVIVDGASAVIDQFKKKHPDYTGELVLDYFESYTPEKPFDVIVMGFVLEHVDDPDLILKRYSSF